MREIIGWKAWFIANGALTMATSEEAGFCTLPDTMIGVKSFHNDGTSAIFQNYDYYFTAEGVDGRLLMACDVDVREINRRKDIENRYPTAVIKRGIWTDPGTMEIADNEMRDATWP